MECKDFDDSSSLMVGNETTVFSPVSGLAAALSSQSLGTPRRRLSLDTDASSGTPIDTPGRMALIVEMDSPDSSSHQDDNNSPTSIIIVEQLESLDEQGDACISGSSTATVPVGQVEMVEETSRHENQSIRSLVVPSLVLSSFQSLSSDGGSSGGDLRTPGVMMSPAPSPVFHDEDSSDSGYGGDHPVSMMIAPIHSANDEGLFLCPRPRPIRSQASVPKSQDDGYDLTEDAIFEAMEVDHADEAASSEIAGLLQKEILYEAEKKSPEPTDRFNETPIKRKTSGRLSRYGFERQQSSSRIDVSVKRAVNNENDESHDQQEANCAPLVKRRKSLVEQKYTTLRAPFKPLNRSHSEADAFFAVHKDDNCHLIGDQSMPHALPIMDRPHINDLNCISHETLYRLMNGDFDHVVHNYTLMDCRYPYEYEGGHIRGAINVYTPEQLIMRMLEESVISEAAKSLENSKRHIFIFYCEFSRERGPRMTRFLRERDRQLNEQYYPRLFYPEIYLLDGGYKNFYANCKEQCEPQTYRPMHDENHVQELRKFRNKSKSWCTTSGGGGDVVDSVPTSRRPGLNRGLFSSKGY